MLLNDLIDQIHETNGVGSPNLEINVAIGPLAHTSYFKVTGFWTRPGKLDLVLPESVADRYRMEGRRKLQGEMRELIAASRR